VQYALRDLEEMGLIEIVREGGKDGKSTSEYRFNILRLHEFAGLIEADDRGANPASLPDEGRNGCTGGVQEATDRGAPVAPKPSITIKQPSARAGVRMRDDRASPALKTEAASGQYHIRADERPAEYRAWVEWHRKHSLPAVVGVIERHRQLVAPSLMPGET
jgi:hypothetical protein